jgi:hypothetical protein
MEKILSILLPPALAAVLIFGGLIFGWYRAPGLVERVHYLLAYWPRMTGVWLALGVVGVDFMLVSLRDAVGYRNVGAKSAAHYNLRGDQK